MKKRDVCLLCKSNSSILLWQGLIEWKWPRPWKIVYWATNLCNPPPACLAHKAKGEKKGGGGNSISVPLPLWVFKPHIQYAVHSKRSIFNLYWMGVSSINPNNTRGGSVGVERISPTMKQQRLLPHTICGTESNSLSSFILGVKVCLICKWNINPQTVG